MRRYALWAIVACCGQQAHGGDRWLAATNSHVAVYAETSPAAARETFRWFEQLRGFFEQNGLLPAGLSERGAPPLRVICLRDQEYEKYRTRPVADAYWATDGARDTIVLAESNPGGTAAHEYAHYVLHVSGWKLPPGLSEGVAEFFSTLRPVKGGFEMGGVLAARLQTLRGAKWLPLSELLELRPETRAAAAIFYAESWALADLLFTSPRYAPQFPALVAAFGTGSNAPQVFQHIYGKSLDQVSEDLRRWTGEPKAARLVLTASTETAEPHTFELSVKQSEALLAQIALASGHLELARKQYEDLLREEPANADARAALGAIALRQGNKSEAVTQWQLALKGGVEDAQLCYRYALLAEEAGSAVREVMTALERAVALDPGFDDARYKLALLENGAGEYRLAVEHLRAMRIPIGTRQFSYWTALASALTELDEREEAQQAAHQALQAAQTADDRLMARRLAYIAATDVRMQFATDSAGHSQIVTTRVAHGASNWNPFVEPSDHMQRAKGKLAEVLCTAGKLSGFRLRTNEGFVNVEVADPSHVLMRNAPAEFYCGPAQEKAVEADFAVVAASGKTKNILRGMTFE